MIQGRGLFYGAASTRGSGIRVFTPADWDAACAQAKAWGIHIVHPKVADGPNCWYDSNGLHMLKSTAEKYGLLCAPYHYLWGNLYPYGNDKNQLVAEANMLANLANFFGVMCPDIEGEWDNEPAWATQLGQIVRSVAPHAEIYPTLFANCAEKVTPYLQLESWIDGWMPMVYFDIWSTNGKQYTAAQAIDWMYTGNWSVLDATVKSHGISPKPILPIIELGNNLPQAEVAIWLEKMQDYGYCGFWYDGTYAPYAQTIQNAPVPVLKVQPPVVVTPPPVLVPVPVPVSQANMQEPANLNMGGLIFVTENPPVAPFLKQVLTAQQAQVLWHFKSPSIPFVPDHAIVKAWIYLLLYRPDIFIGSPLSDEIGTTIDGVRITFITFTSGRTLVWFVDAGHVVLV